jgi:diguanylate cyclase (GGDEF)-like protein
VPKYSAMPFPALAPTAALPAAVADPLRKAVAGAPDVAAAAGAVVDHLAGLGLLPSFYLEQGGRLRCQAVRGYWQIFDGIPFDRGVIGRTFRTGEPTYAVDGVRPPDYMDAGEGVVAEICIPVRAGGRVVGVLNAEAHSEVDSPTAAEVLRCAALLSARLDAFGPLDVASPAQTLARSGARLAALSDTDAIVAEAAQAARELSGFGSAMLATQEADGTLRVRHADGPLATALASLDAERLDDVAGWIDGGTSSYTIGEAAGLGFTGHEALRAAGVAALLVLPLTASGERLGLLLLVDRAEIVLPTHEVELLELLAMQAAAGLRMAAAVRELRERAERDPLTGLGHHATFHAAVPAARQGPGALAVILADLDGFKQINDSSGHAAGDAVLRAVAALLRDAAPPGGGAYRVGGDEFAVLAPVTDLETALALSRRIGAVVREQLGVTLSIGLALSCAGEPDQDIVARADAAVYAVKRGGRDGVAVG